MTPLENNRRTACVRRMKTMLTVIVCAMLVTVATGIAQTTILLRMCHDGTLQRDRMEQLMLNQQATLATLFDTDSANVPMLVAPAASRDAALDASPVEPVSTAHASASAKAHGRHTLRHSGGIGR